MSAAPHSRSVRRLSPSSLARREQRAAARRRRKLLAGGAALAILVTAPLSISAFMGMESAFPGLDAAKSFLAMMTDRSPGDRTAAELTKTKSKKVAEPKQRALGKINKPETPSEFLEAIAPPPPSLTDLPPFPVALAALGPLVELPPVPPGGGGFTTADTPPPGGGGGGGGGENPPTENPPENPPPPVVPEPGTWATMLLGFGLTGWMMRRRRRSTAVACRA